MNNNINKIASDWFYNRLDTSEKNSLNEFIDNLSEEDKKLLFNKIQQYNEAKEKGKPVKLSDLF